MGEGAVRQDQRFIFFATGWVHGKEIAVTELGRLLSDAKTNEEVSQAVAALPELRLSQRIASAALIVHGVVAQIERATDIPNTASEHDPAWMRATIEVRETLKGEERPGGRWQAAEQQQAAPRVLAVPGQRRRRLLELAARVERAGGGVSAPPGRRTIAAVGFDCARSG